MTMQNGNQERSSSAAVLQMSPIVPNGFRNLFGPPLPHQRFRVHGKDPLESPENRAQACVLMRKLSLRMEAEIEWPAHHVEDALIWENPYIPSGYAYLLQFVGHDLAHTSIPFSMLSDQPRHR